MQDRLLSKLLVAIRRASNEGESEVVQILRDSPALTKAIEALQESYDVTLEKTDNVKLTIKL